MSSCKKTKCLISFVSVFILMFAFEHLFHGCTWMNEQYKNTSFWRSPEEIHAHLSLYVARIAILAAFISCLYKKLCKSSDAAEASCSTEAPKAEGACATKKCCPYQKGICFGFKIGVIMGTVQASNYIWLPISSDLAIAWFVGTVVEGVLVGLLLSIINKKKQDCTKA